MKIILITITLLTMHAISFGQKVKDSTRRMAAKGDVLVQKNVIYNKSEIDKNSARESVKSYSTRKTVTKKKRKRHIRKRKVRLMK